MPGTGHPSSNAAESRPAWCQDVSPLLALQIDVPWKQGGQGVSGDRDRAAPPRAGWFWLCHVSCHQSGLCLEEEEGARGRIRHRRGAVPVFGCRGQGFKAAATPAPQARVRSGVCTETVRGQSRDRGLVLHHRCLGSAAGPGSPRDLQLPGCLCAVPCSPRAASTGFEDEGRCLSLQDPALSTATVAMPGTAAWPGTLGSPGGSWRMDGWMDGWTDGRTGRKEPSFVWFCP